MGADDANEGSEPGECVEHRWVMAGVSLTRAGSQIDHACVRCGAVMVETGDELTGRTG